ncbi:MAG: methylmalonyl-CoA mutase [Actinobacteria bacterium]|nr:methylmalonyl-CoA mutase [Actinomycetota bacterium]
MSDLRPLAGEFPPADREQWQALAAKALSRGGREVSPDDVEALMGTPTDDGYTVAALYTAADDSNVREPERPGEPDFRRGEVVQGWQVRQRLEGLPGPSVIAEELAGGTQGLWLAPPVDREAHDSVLSLIEGIDTGTTAVVLDALACPLSAHEALLRRFKEQGAAPGSGLGLDPIGNLAATARSGDVEGAVELAGRVLGLDADVTAFTIDATVYHEAGASFGEEIGTAAAAGLSTMRRLIAAGIDVEDAAKLLEFRFAVTDDQFASIAKLRAARLVWNRVLEVAGVSEPAAQRQHAVTSWVMLSQRDVWVNILRNTVAAFAAGAGGAQALTVLPHTAALAPADEFARRVARNISHLLLEESHVGAVVDPIGGSWYGERRTVEIATAAWEWLQELEGSGGLRRCLDSGVVGDRFDRTWRVKSDQIDQRSAPLTGVSEFPDDKRLTALPDPYVRPGGGLPKRRWAQGFEALRDRADAAVAAGRSVTVRLLALGSLAENSARVGFARNLFAAGGIDCEVVGVEDDWPESGVVCVCGTDKAYEESLSDLLAGAPEAVSLYVAGKPKRGADRPDITYIHVGCDATEILEQTLARLEVS